MRVLIVEDDFIYVKALEVLLSDIKMDVVNSTGDSEEAFRLIKAIKPDIILLDVNLKGKWNGIEIADYIRKNELPILVIYLTSAIDETTFRKAKETAPYSYITKPLDKENFKRTLFLACKHKKEQSKHTIIDHSETQIQEEYVIVKIDKALHKINISDIFLINVEGKYCSLVIGKKEIRAKISLNELLDKIDSPEFIKVNRSSVVNVKKIESYDLEKNIVHIGAHCMLISRRNKTKVKQALTVSNFFYNRPNFGLSN